MPVGPYPVLKERVGPKSVHEVFVQSKNRIAVLWKS
jgi:hypothetical protein